MTGQPEGDAQLEAWLRAAQPEAADLTAHLALAWDPLAIAPPGAQVSVQLVAGEQRLTGRLVSAPPVIEEREVRCRGRFTARSGTASAAAGEGHATDIGTKAPRSFHVG